MMQSFFSSKPDIHWDVEKYYQRDAEKQANVVTFDFFATHSEDGVCIKRKGVETITFDDASSIKDVNVEHVEVLEETPIGDP